jgi:MFS superfamily sulfate permease-like transporter
MKTIEIPKEGIEGLRQNWRVDALSGFLVFLLALPLSLGIAKASEFPPAMGVLTAMIGGLVVGIFQGGRLTIKGPAAGLITVCSGAVLAMGSGKDGWHMACGVIVVTAAIQFTLGVLKFGSVSDFFPHSAVHGMLAAIGLIIFAKQFPILLGVDPALTRGLSPIELYLNIPNFIMHETSSIAFVGITSLVIMFALPAAKINFIKKFPAPMIVLLVTIPLAAYLNFKSEFPGSLVAIGNFWENVTFNASFDAIGTYTFWKFVFMFLFVNSLESLLTVKAIDGLDPWRRKSDYNTDLRALAVGNGIAGLLGGLPMISEVARSSANVNFGGRTRWANVFHGLFLFLAMLLVIPVIEMIPNAALAAMLIFVAYRLASPKEFIGTYKIGAEQLVIFMTTIIVTIAEDLLLGVAAGILVKLIFHIINGAPLSSLFKSNYELEETEKGYTVKVKDCATFSNFLGYKKMWDAFQPGRNVVFNFAEAHLVDHSFMDQLHHFEETYHHTGGKVSWIGLEKFSPFSNHPLAARKIGKDASTKLEIRLSPRQIELRDFTEANEYNYYPQKVRNVMKYKDFPIQKGNKILYEENVMLYYGELCKIEVSDMTLSEGARQAQTDTHITVLHITETELHIPDFALEPERLWTKLSELTFGKDIDFEGHPEFSSKYYLRGDDGMAVRDFFTKEMLQFLESHDDTHIESHKNRLLFYRKRDLMDVDEIKDTVQLVEEFIALANHGMQEPAQRNG